jgi:hypothetical protein
MCGLTAITTDAYAEAMQFVASQADPFELVAAIFDEGARNDLREQTKQHLAGHGYDVGGLTSDEAFGAWEDQVCEQLEARDSADDVAGLTLAVIEDELASVDAQVA